MSNKNISGLFKRIRFAKNAPISYQKLAAMSLNDQYLKDNIDALPKGTVVIKGRAVNSGGFSTKDFDPGVPIKSETFTLVEDGRMIGIAFKIPDWSFNVAPASGEGSDYIFEIDGVEVGRRFANDHFYYFIVQEPISSGTHTLEIFNQLNSTTTGEIISLNVINVIGPSIIIEDLGEYISPGSTVEE